MSNTADLIITGGSRTVTVSPMQIASIIKDANSHTIVFADGSSLQIDAQQYETVKALDYSGGGGGSSTDPRVDTLSADVQTISATTYGYDEETIVPIPSEGYKVYNLTFSDEWLTPSEGEESIHHIDDVFDYNTSNNYLTFAVTDEMLDAQKVVISVSDPNYHDIDVQPWIAHVTGDSRFADLQVYIAPADGTPYVKAVYGVYTETYIFSDRYVILSGTVNDQILNWDEQTLDGKPWEGGSETITVHHDGLTDKVSANTDSISAVSGTVSGFGSEISANTDSIDVLNSKVLAQDKFDIVVTASSEQESFSLSSKTAESVSDYFSADIISDLGISSETAYVVTIDKQGTTNSILLTDFTVPISGDVIFIVKNTAKSTGSFNIVNNVGSAQGSVYVTMTQDNLYSVAYCTNAGGTYWHSLAKNTQKDYTDGTGITVNQTQDLREAVDNMLWQGTQAEYDAIETKDNNTLYLINE